MAENNSLASQNGVPEARIVQSLWPDDFRGFLYCKNQTDPPTQYWALYNDGVTEEINPPTGTPRPEPDLADRTKRFKLPTSLISGNDNTIVLPSRFTGLMRQVVQCEYNRGEETKYSSTWQKTHGLMEVPYPRVVGGTKEQETTNAGSRKFWLIEVSQQGIYAAQVKMGTVCRTCLPVRDFQPTEEQLDAHPEWSQYVTSLSLEWAYTNRNESGAVKQLKSSAEMGVLYSSYGSPWQNRIGWAFNLQGSRAVNVVAKREDSTWKTRLLTLSFNLEYGGYSATIVRISPTVAQVTLPGHGFPNGRVVVVSGANQSAYNGSFIVKNSAENTFEYDVAGVPSTPATGNIKVADANDLYTLSVGVHIGQQGKVSFLAKSVLWHASSSSTYSAPIPYVPSLGDPAFKIGNGPVYAFYNKNDLVEVRWRCDESTIIPPSSGAVDPAPYSEGVIQVHNCQSTTTTTPSGVNVWSSSHFSKTGRNYNKVGFYCQQYDGVIESDQGQILESTSSVSCSLVEGTPTIYNANAVYDYCGSVFIGSVTYSVAAINVSRTISAFTVGQNNQRSSFLVLPWHDRESVGFLTQHFLSETVTTYSYEENLGQKGTKTTFISSSGEGEFSSHTIYEIITPSSGGSPPPGSVNQNTSKQGTLHLIAGNELTISKGIAYDGSLNPESYVADLLTWAESKTAVSDLFFMRGGMVYKDPALSPADQTTNYVEKLGSATHQALIGFGSLAGKKPICFVGKV